jgi:hypothetical protein
MTDCILESRMDEIADRVALRRSRTLSEETDTYEANRSSH